jgi:hypothetical protein
MIDTIKIKLHNLKKHSRVYDLSIANDDIIKTMPKRGKKNHEVGEYDLLEYGRLIDRQVHYYQKDSKAVEVLKVHNRFSPSSHYSLKAYINPIKDCIVYEFSVPKYFFGTNVLMALPMPNEPNYFYIKGGNDTFEYIRKTYYNNIAKYIQGFFKFEYPECEIDYTDVEIVQFDICWNQVFNDKRDSLKYLEHQKAIKKNYLRPDSRFYMNYETSIFYGGSGYKAEIYHKGSEYAKNDRKKHEKINERYQKKGLKPVFNVDAIQALADRTLRYEVSLRGEKLSYLFNEHIFRSGSKSFQVLKKIFNKVSSKVASKNVTQYSDFAEIVKEFNNVYINSQKHINVIEYIVQYFRKRNDGEPITEHEIYNSLLKFHRNFDRLTNTGRKFFCQLTEEEFSYANTDRKSNIMMFETSKYHLFDKELFQVAFDFFINFVNEFKVEEKSSINHYMDLVDKENERRAEVKEKNKYYKKIGLNDKQFIHKVEPQLDKCRMGMLLGFLENYTSDQLRKITGMNDRTWRKYKNDLKAIGVTKNTLNNTEPIRAVYDLSEYYQELTLNLNKYRITNSNILLDIYN